MSERTTIYIDGKPVSAQIGEKLSRYLSSELPCGGHGKCGKCKVTVEGVQPELEEQERTHLSPQEISAGVRLACSVRISGTCRITTHIRAGNSQKQIVTEGTMPDFAYEPSFAGYGAAIDIGTTTLAAKLFNHGGQLLSEASQLNPQTSWGADVISRIEAAVKGEADQLRKAICTALDSLIRQLAEAAQIQPDQIDGLVITGNSVMLALFTGTSVEPFSHAPFALHRAFGEVCTAKELALASPSPGAEVYLPPCMAAFVGADAVCALLAARLCDGAETKLLVDIGTNGEICLWHDRTLYAASAAAGPAFEGVGIRMGMRGAHGAIDRVEAGKDGLTVHTIGNGPPQGICGSGLIDAVAALRKQGLMDESGLLEPDPISLTETVFLTQQDIRMVQLAKSAICAGIDTLLETAGITAAQVEEAVLAGGFGNYLNINNAAGIGLIPKPLTGKFHAAGNAALSGAAMLLLNRNFRRECKRLAARAKVVDLSGNPIFTKKYMTGMWFPTGAVEDGRN